MSPRRQIAETGLRAARIAVLIVVAGTAVPAATDAPAQMTAEETATATNLGESVQVMGNLRALPGGCPAAGQGLVELAELLKSVDIPAPESVVLDGWGNPVLAWCSGADWAVLSRGADGLPGGTYDKLPEVSQWGDDFVLFGDDRAFLPAHIQALMQAGRQKRTMADMRSIAITLEAYLIDHDALPDDPTGGFVPVETLQDAVQPIYIRYLPLADGWGNPIWVWIENGQYRIVSAGMDGVVQHDYAVTAGAGATATLDSDIVFGDGQFVQWPEGPQSP